MTDPIYGFLDGFLPGLKWPTIVELGAHEGTDTCWITSRLKRPFFYVAVEPDPRNFLALQDALGDDEDVKLVMAAVGNQSGLATFYLSGGVKTQGAKPHTDSSSLKEPTGLKGRYPWMTFTESRVLVYPLDTITSTQ